VLGDPDDDRYRPGRAGASQRRRHAITSIAFTQRLLDTGIDDSVGSVGDAYDSAIPETHASLLKNKFIEPDGPWCDITHVKAGISEYGHLAQHPALPRNHR
jgi:hypothetical protein